MSKVLNWRWAVMVAALSIAACAADRPAPIEHRTGAPAPAVRAAPPVATPLPAPQPSEQAGVRARPVAPSGVQVRPLQESTAASSSGAAPTRAQPPAGAVAPGALRTQPQGLKRPYSEHALADLKGAEAAEPADARASQARKGEPAKGEGAPGKGESESGKADAGKGDAARAKGGAEFAWPAKGKLLQGFAEPRSMGIAIAGSPGDPVQAAADGRVIFAGAGPRGYGNLLIIKHDADTLTVYAHNRTLLVKDGAQVRRGQQIAEIGDSGTDRPKLHFEIRKSGKPVDPITLLPDR